jgi:hypothetical protein
VDSEAGRRAGAFGPQHDRFGVAMIMVVASILLSAVFGNHSWGRVLGVSVEGVTLLFILVTSGARRLTIRLCTAAVVLAVIATAAAALGGTDAGRLTGVAIGALLALVAPVAIARRLMHHERITAQTVFGALCLYLLAGLFFAFVFSAVGIVQHGFFVQTQETRSLDYTYFSFVTLATVGYGDLTARTDVGRMLSITEALLGQLYLVSAVALLISNIGTRRTGRRSREPDDVE